MAERKPIFLFAFSNAYNDLPQLKEEETAIRNALSNIEDQGKIQYRSLGGTTLDDIFKSFNRFHNQIAVFHYGGHSDEQFLELEDKLARAYSLAYLMGAQENLQLVFLNGCSNKQQVERLLEAGVKAVVATDRPIEDTMAADFARQFYEALSGGKSIEAAFKTAKAYVQNDEPEREIISHRGSGREASLESVSSGQKIPWGLYASDEAHLDWTVPDPIELPENPNLIQDVDLLNPDINKRLVESILEGMAQVDDTHQQLYDHYKANPSQYFNEAQNCILDNFPLILSIQIRDLFTPEGRRKGRIRLQMLNDTYLILGQLLVSFALANLWEAVLQFKAEDKNLLFRESFKSDIKEYLNRKKEQFGAYDYFWLLGSVGRIFDENDIQPFIEEFASLKSSILVPDQYYDAYRFLEQELRVRLQAQDIDVDEIEFLCEDAENQLGLLLQKCAFLSSYQFLTINDIEVDRLRNQQTANFIHERVLLRGRDASTLDESPLKLDKFIFNQSIIVAKNGSDEITFLNLSPFIIDENAFKLRSDQSKILFYAYRTSQGVYYFQNAFNLSDKLFRVQERYHRSKYLRLDKVIKQFELFEQDLDL